MRAPSLDGLVSRVPVLWRALAAMLVLCGLIGAIVESRARILRSGTEVRLRTVPVDPRDLFRGDYVVLSYDISEVDAGAADAIRDFKRGQAVHVRLVRDADGFARAAGVSAERPPVTGSDVVMAGRVLSTGACARSEDGSVDCARGRNGLRIAYGLESYFVPQGSGRAIERTPASRVEVVAGVSASGEAAIKRLLIDGKLVHAEPPY
jgi:uncharacterized membrane-anchored protein